MLCETKMAADPWLLKDKNEKLNDKDESKLANFEDSFKPYEKLPDSALYISSLELKLSKLQGKQGDVKTSDIVHSLESTRDQHMRDFLSNSDHVLTPTDFDSEVNNERFSSPSNVVLRKLRPEKQALSAEELKNLIIADELSKIAAELKEAIAAAADEKEEDEETEIKL